MHGRIGFESVTCGFPNPWPVASSVSPFLVSVPSATAYGLYAVAYAYPANASFERRIQLRTKRLFARPSEGWSVNILPVRSTAALLPRHEMQDQAPFACDDEAGMDTEASF